MSVLKMQILWASLQNGGVHCYIWQKEEISMRKKERGFFGLLLDFILTLATGGLWLIWILIRFLRNR